MANTSNAATAGGPYTGPVVGETQANPKERERIYTLHFRQGNLVQQKHFNFRGPLAEAVIRAREHCQKMGSRFIWCRPFVVDLDHQENLKAQGLDLEDIT